MSLFMVITYYLGSMLFFCGAGSLFTGAVFYFDQYVLFLEWEIFTLGSSSLIMTFIFDWMSLSFMGLVSIISSMVLFYSTFYMEGDKFLTRFIYLVYLFVLSMVFLILSPNMVSILLGWDGLGLVSYCLVIYYQNNKSANAGMVTILSNRIGDVAILLCIAWLLNFGSWNFFFVQFMFDSSETTLMLILVVLAALTKSAQMPFSAWLPAAMAAPTPVSALVHSSTLVTAGVYLVIRFSHLMGSSSFLFFIGVLTMFMSGLGANFENDLKKIIALSTLSQLGLMMMTLGLGLGEYAFFHLLTHAMFKSLLFLCAGVFIHSMGDLQDIRMMGGLTVSCPTTSFYFVCSSMALCGFPFLSGFYSKDMILELFFMSGMNTFMLFMVFVSTLLTLAYSTRLAYFIFFNNFGSRSFINMSEEGGMLTPMSVLLMFSMFGGGWMSIYFFPLNFIFLPLAFKVIVLLGLSVVFIFSFFLVSSKSIGALVYTRLGYFFTGSMWFLPFLTTSMFMPLLKSGAHIVKFVDQGWVEFMGGQGFITKARGVSTYVDMFNFLNLKFYLFAFFVGVVLVMSF